MKRKESPILYIFIGLILLLGIFSFIFREQLSNKFLHYDYTAPAPVSNVSADSISLELLLNEKVVSLKDSISLFNYEDLNKSQDLLADEFRVTNASAPILYDEEGNPLPKKTFFRVSVGNGNPFVVEKKPK